MKLDKYQRLILANQYRILERLAGLSKGGKAEADSFADIANAFEEGFESSMDSVIEHIFDGLSREDCRFVNDAMAMFDALQRSYDALGDKSAIEAYQVNSFGFDGNNETTHMAYARYVIEKERRFTSLRNADNCNSHTPNIPRYAAMLQRWIGNCGRSYKLSAPEIRDIVSA